MLNKNLSLIERTVDKWSISIMVIKKVLSNYYYFTILWEFLPKKENGQEIKDCITVIIPHWDTKQQKICANNTI